ncbi:MAG TPA: response regulator transcription factor [Hyphomicrobiales bacterium]|nr:response regulator transcription factor [Hyphomicrobiales bacterium]
MALEREPLADDAPHILLIDDDQRIRALLARFLGDHGYRVTAAASAADARTRLHSFDFDLLVVDVMMPGESGVELARWLRAHSAVPMLMLTAKGEAADRVEGLESGADDYVTKPFEPRELLLRIAGILRRVTQRQAAAATIVSFGGFAFDRRSGTLKRGEETVRLTEREREMLDVLAEQGGETVPRSRLAGPGAAGERAVDVQINRLRRKIEDDPTNPILLQTVRGIGYRLVMAP